MKWSTLDPNDVIESGLAAEYRQRRRLAHDQLVTLNTDVFILSKLTQFPWPIFVEQPAMEFWVGVIQKFFAYSLRRITTCGNNQGGPLMSVPRFADWVCERVRPAYRLPLQYAVRDDVAFVLAEQHALAPTRTSWTEPEPSAFEELFHDVVGVPLEHYRALVDALNRIYEVLAFDAGSVLRDVPDDTGESEAPCDDRPDIVKLLDELALQSELLYLPERQQAMWIHHKLHVWPEHAVRQFNVYRKRAGLVEA